MTLVKMFEEIIKDAKPTKAGRPSAQQKHEAIVKALQMEEHESFIISSILQANYNKQITFAMPAGEPPFKEREDEPDFGENQVKIFASCTARSRGSLPEKEMRFINLLGTLSLKDAKLLCLVKDGKLEEMFPTITEKAVAEAFDQGFI